MFQFLAYNLMIEKLVESLPFCHEGATNYLLMNRV